MQFAGLNYVFCNSYYISGGGRCRKKLCPMSSAQDKGRTQDHGHSFFSYKDLPRPLINCFLPSEIARLNLEKETGKKSIMLTKYHVVLLKASSCGCKILFFHFAYSDLNPFTLTFE